SKIENRQSLALAYFRLAEAQFRTQKNEAAIESAQKAVDLYLALGDLSGAGRAYWAMANGYTQIRQIEKRDEALHKALAYCQQVGDNYGLGNALNTISVTEVDITKAFRTFQQSIEAFEKAGYLDRIQIPRANLAVTYLELGLYSHAARLQGEVLEANRRMNAQVGFIYALGNIAGVYIALGQFETALTHQKEFTTLVETLGDPNMENQAETNWADLKFNMGDLKAALRHQKAALRIAQQHQLGIEVTALTELGKIQLANGDLVNALKTTTKATTLHRAEGFAKQDSFTQQAIWWRHTQALLANKKNKETQEALDRAYNFLLESIQNIRDEGLRRNALNKVAENRELIQYWVADGKKRKLSKERLFAHLNIESNLREPFQRLSDTGLRLNALKSIQAIQTFLVEEATELIGGERLILERTAHFSRKAKVPTKVGSTELILADSLLPRGEDASVVLKSIRKYLDKARQTRTTQLLTADGRRQTKEGGQRSVIRGLGRIIAPLIAQNTLLGYLYVDMDSIYGTFDNTDRDMLGMLANQGAVALDNAGLIAGLEQKVEERTAQLQEHISELQIINSIQQGLAAELDFQAIVDLVGDKLREVLATPNLGIVWIEESQGVIHTLYAYEHNQRLTIAPVALLKTGRTVNIIATRKPVIFNTVKEMPNPIPGTDQAKSAIYVPIISKDRVIGILDIENFERENAFGESELRLLTTIAASLGTALENARLFDETQRLLRITEERNAELAIINSVQAALAAELNIQGIYDAVGDKVREIFHQADLNIRIIDPQTNLLHYPYMYENGKRLDIFSTPLQDVGFSAYVFRTRETVVINENLLEEEKKFGSFTLPGTESEKSVVFVPLIAGDQVRGLINLVSMEEHAFSESDVRLLQTLANSMSVALENARLFDETQRLLKETEQRAQELAIINSVQQGLASKLDMQAIFELVGEKIQSMFNAQSVLISSFDHEKQVSRLDYAFEDGKRIFDDELLPFSAGNLYMIETRQPIIINENAGEESIKYGLKTIKGTELAKSLIFVPFGTGDKVNGYFSLQNFEHEHAFSESDIRLLGTLAGSMGIALESARLFDETQHLLKVTEDRAAELAIINSVQEGLASKL
ncbi:MAG: GAF domain-containing protein, partial [Chloroflexi bacterium]|nr:GAF domain-containing protein [Chloroflexota bacterium]